MTYSLSPKKNWPCQHLLSSWILLSDNSPPAHFSGFIQKEQCWILFFELGPRLFVHPFIFWDRAKEIGFTQTNITRGLHEQNEQTGRSWNRDTAGEIGVSPHICLLKLYLQTTNEFVKVIGFSEKLEVLSRDWVEKQVRHFAWVVQNWTRFLYMESWE